MLGKLLKHEFIYSYKRFVPLYIAFAAVAAALRIMEVLFDNVFTSDYENLAVSMLRIMLYIVFFAGLYALLLYSIFGNVSRFHKNLFTDEGYLMNTLPVPVHNNILCKLISGLVWYVITLIIVFTGAAVVFYDTLDLFSGVFFDSVGSLLKDNAAQLITSIASSVVAFCAFLLLCYMCEAIRSMSGTNMFIAVLLIVGFSIANSIIISIITGIVSGFADAASMTYDESYTAANIVKIIYYAIASVVLFFITNSIMKKRLNLE